MSVNKKPNIAVFCSGNGSNLQALILAEKKRRLKGRIALVVCDKPSAFAIVRANKANIPVALIEPKDFGTKQAYDLVIANILKKAKINLVVLAGFMRILTPSLVNMYKGRMLNIHPSLLPSFKGAYAIRDAFEAGVKVTGVTVHFVTAELDSGPIISQEAIKVTGKDTIESLTKRIHRAEHELYPKAINTIITKRR